MASCETNISADGIAALVGKVAHLVDEVERLRQDIMAVKKAATVYMDDEGELSEWAIRKLRESRKRNKLIPHDEVRKLLGL